MPAAKKPVATPPTKTGSNPIYVLLIAVSLAINGYLLFYKQDKQNQSLVTVNGQAFRWKDISPQAKQAMADLDQDYYNVLKREADIWAENQVLPKEAQKRSMSVSDLLKKEAAGDTQIPKEEVYQRYVQSPQADTVGTWPQVLTEIENEMRTQKSKQLKQAYLDSLFAQYGVRYQIKPPRSEAGSAEGSSTRFPIYRKNIEGAPRRGPAQAPVTLEVYSDFMCPYSVKFNTTLQELLKLYPDKIQVAFRHFPLPFHQGAHLMAEASICAEEQGKFWEYHDQLMTDPKKREKPELVQIANQLGLSMPKFSECLDSGRHTKKVDSDIALGKANGVQGTPGYLINGRRGSGAMPVDLMKPIIDWHLAPNGPYPGRPQQPAKQPGDAGKPPANVGVDPSKVYTLDPAWLKKGFSQGPENAPVTLVEFFDYNCPFCRRGAETSDAMVAQYGSKLRRVAKHYPLPMHPNAGKTSEALLCAHEQSKFMEMRKAVLGDEFWGKNSTDDLKMIAQKIGLNTANFNTCLDSGQMKAIVDEDMKMAAAANVGSTPTFMINGSPLVGAQPAEAFQKAIDEKLNAKK